MSNVLVVSEDQAVCQTILSCFSSPANATAQAASRAGALEKLQEQRYDFVFIDLALLREGATENGFRNVMQPFWLLFPTIEIIVMSDPERIRDAVKAVKEGAGNYLTYPITPEEVQYVTKSLTESLLVESELHYLRDHFWQADSLKLIQTKSPLMQEVYDKVRSVAPTISTVLLIGETGTGKGVLARLLHRHSSRAQSPFTIVHCGAITDTLIESELFGHEKGAFTGAIRRKLGKFEIAKAGTIFLDEIATISSSLQIKLLQVLQEKIFQRVGGEQNITANARVIAATNMDLLELCNAGLFRKDLYFRLNVFPLEIPPLRARKEDIPLLVETFLQKLNKFEAKEIHGVHPEVLEALGNYSWPGNIRELENLIERAYILEETSILTPKNFPAELFSSRSQLPPEFIPDSSKTLAETRKDGIELLEKSYLRELLNVHQGRLKKTAARAGISTRQLHKLMKKHDLHKENFKKKK